MKFMFNNSVHTIHPVRRTAISVLGLSMALVVGCDSDSGDGDGNLAARFSVGTIVVTADDALPFVAFTDDVDEPGLLELGQAIEAGAGGVYSAGQGNGVFFTGEPGSILQRWRFTDGGLVARDGRISFANQGLDETRLLPSSVQFISPNKAYVLNVDGPGVIIWDPERLEITGGFEIPDVPREVEGGLGSFSYNAIRDGDQIAVTYYYLVPGFSSFVSRSHLIVLDTASDSARTDVTNSCGDLAYGAQTEGGDIFFASDFLNAAFNRFFPDQAPPPCLVRVDARSARFDADFETLTALAGGRTAANLVSAGGSEALIRVYDDSVAPVTPDDTIISFINRNAWRWWSVDLDSMEARPLPGSSLGTGQTLRFEVGNDNYVIRVAETLATTTLERVVQGQTPQPGLTVTGIARSGIVQN